VIGRRQLLSALGASAIYPVAAPVHADGEFARDFDKAVGEHANGMQVIRTPLMVKNRARIAALAAGKRLPAIYDDRAYVEAGGVMSYRANIRDLYRHTAACVDKILKGAKPADLPVEQPTTLEPAVNMKAAKALGMKFPNSILVQATKVIE